MPDVFPEAYDHEEVPSFVRALESAEQYTAAYSHKMANEGLLYLDSGITTIATDESFYGYVENPSSEEYPIIALEPVVESAVTMEFHAYFNATVDTGTFNSTTVNNLESDTLDEFQGNAWNGASAAVTVSDTGTEFYSSIIGTGKKSGGTGGANLIAKVAPGDNLLFEIRNNGTLSGSSGTVSFQAPYHEQNDEFEL